MNEIDNIENYERKGRNLYKLNGKYYRLFGYAVTPNGCWIASPEMREITDICAATGLDVMGEEVIKFEPCGTVSASGREFIKV